MTGSSDIVAVRGYLCPTGHDRNLLFVAVQTRDGVVGFGEGSQSNQDHAVLANIRQVAEGLLGRSALDMIERMVSVLRSARTGRAMFVAISALEIAVWDVIGKTLGTPVFRLLGGRMHDRLECYATMSAGIDDWSPDGLASHAKGCIERGYRGVKIVPFRDRVHGEDSSWSLQRLVDRVRAVREVLGPQRKLYIECDFAFDPALARQVAGMVAPYDCHWLEAPLLWDDPDGLAALRGRIPQRVASGEMALGRIAARAMIEARAVDVLQPDVKWTGGILEAKKISAWAESCQMAVAPHNNSGPVATAASAHLAATLPNFEVLETPSVSPEWEPDLTRGGTLVRDGAVDIDALAGRPGLGLDIDEAVASRVAGQDGAGTVQVTGAGR
jgi:galactonate dehydratase